MTITRTITLALTPAALKTVLGEYNAHLKYLQNRLDIAITQRGDNFILTGDTDNVMRGEYVLQQLAQEADQDISPDKMHLLVQSSFAHKTNFIHKTNQNNRNPTDNTAMLRTRKGKIIPRGDNQSRYVKKILSSDISFGVGPAGTGKTYLAVAVAVDMLERGEIERILLVRPAVEAGEKLGFLPGDLTQKIDPYLRPLYDALYEMLGFEKVGKLIERQIIEVAPLAYMRGRTLNNSFVILDEAQNTTAEQMKMFLTRLGFGSRAVITGDTSQVDLPRGHQSGLTQALAILGNIDEIHITYFDSHDVVRHHLVQKIVQAYDKFDDEQQQQNALKKQARQAQKAQEEQDNKLRETQEFVSKVQDILHAQGVLNSQNNSPNNTQDNNKTN